MKKSLLLIASALLVFAGCKYDDSELWEELNAQKAQIAQLQKEKAANADLTSITTILTNLQKNVYVSKVEQNANGYVITFTDGSTATISNGKDGATGAAGKDGAAGAPGKDGATPVISVKQDNDGVYYWTVNGEWLTDSNGNKISASGSGEGGGVSIVPKIKAENGKWYFSINGGQTWEEAGEVTASEAEGLISAVTTDEENAYLTLSDGTVITIPISGVEKPKIYILPEGGVFAVKPATLKFNTKAYANASNIKWTIGDIVKEGADADIVFANGGDYPVTLTATIDGETVTENFTLKVEEWWIDAKLDAPANPRNTYPVFSPDSKKAYFVTRGSRFLYEIDLEGQKVGWKFDLNEGKNDNGGDICVNPKTGDIICSGQKHIFCISKEGQKVWEYEVPNPNPASALLGCGPGMSNDCSVVFCPLNGNKFSALSASTGELLGTYEVGCSNSQFVVYGNNEIVLHVNAAAGGIRMLKWTGTAFEETGRVDSPCALADITSAAMDKAQERVYFGGNGSLVEFNIKDKTARKVGPTASGNNWAPAISESGKLAHATQIAANIVIGDLTKDVANEGSWTIGYSRGANNTLNFTGSTFDREGNVYFFINGDASGNAGFYKIDTKTNEAALVAGIAGTIPEYQGVFNFCNGYLIAGGGKADGNNRILVRAIDAERGHSWSGPGGDVCASKNANLVYAE